jgi:hypothetical protein
MLHLHVRNLRRKFQEVLHSGKLLGVWSEMFLIMIFVTLFVAKLFRDARVVTV